MGSDACVVPVRTIRGRVPVTRLGFGAAQIGNLNRAVTDDEALEVVDAAWEGGIRYFDTAPHYGLGLSERRLGMALASRPREDYTLSTKVGRLLEDSPDTAHLQDSEGFAVPASLRRRWDFSRDGVLRSIEDSLQRLGVDRLDIVYVHDPDSHAEQAISEAIPALLGLRDEGVIGAVGLGMNQTGIPAEAIRRTDLDVVMCANRFTLLEQPALDDLLPLAHERGVAVVAAAIYNSGLLSRPRPAESATYDYGPVPPEVLSRVNTLADALELSGTSLPVAAVQYPLLHPAVVAVVLGLRSPAHVREALTRATSHVPTSLWEELFSSGAVRDPRPAEALG